MKIINMITGFSRLKILIRLSRFFVPDEYLIKYADNDVEFPFDWPPYGPVKEDYEFVGKIRKNILHFFI